MASFPRSIRKLIEGLERLPGIGPRGATRLVFYLINTPSSYIENLAKLFLDLKKKVKICRQCFGVAEEEVCSVCANTKRLKNLICVVERPIDLMAIEDVGGFEGVYHVLGGVINPLDHVGPEDLRIKELIDRVKNLEGEVEIILATNPTMEGEATALYIRSEILKVRKDIKISRIGSGLPMGASLEYADQATLSRALEGRRSI